MIRQIRVLGLAVAAVMAMSAIAASAAQAAPVFEATNGYPATYTGSNTKGNEVFKTEAGSGGVTISSVGHSLQISGE